MRTRHGVQVLRRDARTYAWERSNRMDLNERSGVVLKPCSMGVSRQVGGGLAWALRGCRR